jgi:DNA-binding NarL/FixJ family response regulator
MTIAAQRTVEASTMGSLMLVSELHQTAAQSGDGKTYLEQRSDIAKRLRAAIDLKRVTIIDDQALDADVLAGVMRRIFGDTVRVDCVQHMTALHDVWADGHPDLVFLDDRLGHVGTALTHLPHFARHAYRGPVVVMSGLMTRARRVEVIQAGATEALHKDDLDTLAVMQLLMKLMDAGALPRRSDA